MLMVESVTIQFLIVVVVDIGSINKDCGQDLRGKQITLCFELNIFAVCTLPGRFRQTTNRVKR